MAKRRSKRGEPPAPVAMQVVSAASLEAEVLPPIVRATQQEVDVLEGVVAGKGPQQAMQAAGLDVTPSVADAYVGQLLRNYNEPMRQALLRKGVTLDTLAGKLADLLEATRPVVVRGEGVALYPDNQAQLGAVDRVLDILPGARAPKKHEVETRSLEMILLKIAAEDDDEE